MKKAVRKNSLSMKLDDKAFARLTDIVSVGKYPNITEAIHALINGVPDNVQEEIRCLRQDNKDIRLELKEVRLLLNEILPQLSTKKEINESLGSIQRVNEAIYNKLNSK